MMATTGWGAARRGISAAQRLPRLILVLFVPLFLLALPGALLVRDALDVAFGNSMVGDEFLERFDAILASEALTGLGGAFGSVIHLIFPLGAIGILLNILLAGGTLDIIAEEQNFTLARFLHGCGTYLGRFFGLWLLMAAILVVAAAVLLLPFGAIIAGLINGGADEKTIILRLAVIAGFLFLPLLLIPLAADYARIHIVRGTRSVWKAAGRGFVFVFRNLLPVLALQILFLIILFTVTVVYLVVAEFIGMTTPLTILLSFLVQQIYIYCRLWIRVATIAGEVTLFEGRKRAPVRFYGWDDSPSVVAD